MAIFIIFVLTITLSIFVRKVIILKKELQAIQPIVHLIESTHDIIYTCEIKPEFKYTYLSTSIEKIIGENNIERHLMNPLLVAEHVHPEEQQQLQRKILGQFDFSKPLHWRIKNKDGEYIWYEEFIIPTYKSGEMNGWHGLYRDISASKKLQEELQFKATHDLLTCMYNRDFFEEQCRLYQKTNKTMGVIVCDVDNLKHVNDHFGHKTGDDIIRDAASLIMSQRSASTEFFRIGGDEFVIFIHGATDMMMQQIICQLKQDEYDYNLVHDIPLSISKGYAIGHMSQRTIESLYIEADNEMYVEKQSKKREQIFV